MKNLRIGLAQVRQTGNLDENTATIFRFLENIRVSGERASHIVENMLNFSRSSESRKSPVDLSELLDKAVELAAHDYDLKKKFDFRHIRIVRHYEPALPPVPCAATEIEQVVFNLLRNAANRSLG